MVSDIRQYNMVHRYPNREYFFLNTKGKKITSSSALATIQEKLEEVNNINTTTLALKGVSKLIQKGLTLSEIKYLTGFETKKIEDVSRWLMNQEDVESVINNMKLGSAITLLAIQIHQSSISFVDFICSKLTSKSLSDNLPISS